MPKSRPPYPPEFRRRMIELVRAGRTPEQLATEFEPSAQTIRNWTVQAERDVGQRQDGLTSEERDELRKLRRENKILREEIAPATHDVVRVEDRVSPLRNDAPEQPLSLKQRYRAKIASVQRQQIDGNER